MASTTVRSAIDDLTYDIVTLLQKKAKALAAFETYLEDARDDEDVHDLFAQMRRQEEEHVRLLRDVLADRLAGDVGEDDEEDDDAYDEEADEIEDEGDEAGAGDAGDARDAGEGERPPRRGESSHRSGAV